MFTTDSSVNFGLVEKVQAAAEARINATPISTSFRLKPCPMRGVRAPLCGIAKERLLSSSLRSPHPGQSPAHTAAESIVHGGVFHRYAVEIVDCFVSGGDQSHVKRIHGQSTGRPSVLASKLSPPLLAAFVGSPPVVALMPAKPLHIVGGACQVRLALHRLVHVNREAIPLALEQRHLHHRRLHVALVGIAILKHDVFKHGEIWPWPQLNDVVHEFQGDAPARPCACMQRHHFRRPVGRV